MRLTRPVQLLIAAAVVLIGVYSSTFIVDQTEAAIEIRLGNPIRVIEEPGLYFRLPFITEIWKIDRRLILHDIPPGAIITQDKKTMLVDNYSKWRVVDPLLFYQTVRNLVGAQARLEDIIYSQVRETLGKYTLAEIVSDQRADLMVQVTDNTRAEVIGFGIEMLDVRIKRADLPPENSQAVFGRMEAERVRIAKRYRSEGDETALRIRSGADRDKAEIISAAQKESEIVRGQADAEAAATYANAYNKDPEFFRFLRSQEAYRKTFVKDTTLVFSEKDMAFLKYFE